MSDTWRLIDSGPCAAAFNMALDEALAVTVRECRSAPALRLYGWQAPAVSIGCFQKISDIDVERCAGSGIPIVRRPTGGRAILHGDEITYCFAIRTSTGLFSKGLFDSYKKISLAFGRALSGIGLSPQLKLLRDKKGVAREDVRRSPLCFKSVSYGEISVNSGKIIGSAQKRWSNGLLQQGSIPMRTDIEELAKVFRIQSPERSRGLPGLKDMLPGLETATVKDAIRTSFEEMFDVDFIISSPSEEEVCFARELESQKYSSPLWTFNR